MMSLVMNMRESTSLTLRVECDHLRMNFTAFSADGALMSSGGYKLGDSECGMWNRFFTHPVLKGLNRAKRI